MHQPVPDETIKFLKIKTGEDLVAYVLEQTDDFYRLKRPLSFTVENEVIAGRQMLNVREWIPPIVCSSEEVVLPARWVIFTSEVRDSFKTEFKEAVDFLYGVTPRKRTRKSMDNVVPFASLMKDTSDKPH